MSRTNNSLGLFTNWDRFLFLIKRIIHWLLYYDDNDFNDIVNRIKFEFSRETGKSLSLSLYLNDISYELYFDSINFIKFK